jgi:uncharacterized protein YbjT (DUF2867 family)
MAGSTHSIFVTGGTGYIGTRLISVLLQRGHRVTALSRPSSVQKLPAGTQPVLADALSDDYSSDIAGCDTFIHLIGVSHPSPAKAAEFRSIDLPALRNAVKAASAAEVKQFMFISVAHPAPVMQAYIEVRRECEQIIIKSGLNATVLRPWYVLGPGHRWPYLLIPMYKLMELFPPTRESAQRLGLVTLRQIVETLMHAAEEPPLGIRVLGVPEIRRVKSLNQNTAGSELWRKSAL